MGAAEKSSGDEVASFGRTDRSAGQEARLLNWIPISVRGSWETFANRDRTGLRRWPPRPFDILQPLAVHVNFDFRGSIPWYP